MDPRGAVGPCSGGTIRLIAAVSARDARAPIWDDRTGRLLWIDAIGGDLHSTDPESGADEAYAVGPVSGLALTQDDRFLLARNDELRLFDPRSGANEVIDVIDDVTVGDAGGRTIDGAVDPRGRFWTATTNAASLSNGGHLVILDRDRKARYVRTSVGLSHGIGFSPDGRWLYQADGRARRITRARCDPERGTIGLQDAFVDVSGYLGRSSGIAVDMYGAVWVAFPEGDVVRRFDPNGQLMDEISTPTSAPTGCAFGGPELRTLFVTAVDTSPELAAAAAEQPSMTLLALDAPQPGLLSNRWNG